MAPYPGMLRAACRPVRSFLQRSWNRFLNRLDPPVLILLYHRVTTLAADPQQLAVSPENFRDQMRHLRDSFPLVGLGDDWGSPRETAIAVTFDDGYADNCREALPILEETGVPATFFVGTGSLGTREEFWWDELERLLLEPGEYPERFTLEDDARGVSWPTASPGQRTVLYGDLHRLMKTVDTPCRASWMRRLRDWSGKGDSGRESHRPLDFRELARLAQSPLVSIGAHTVTHPCLSALTAERQREEITASKMRLEEVLGRSVTLFSYPFGGRRDYTRTSEALCREAGFVRVASNFPGLVHRWTNPYALPRRLVRNWDRETFAIHLERFLYR
ncbi:MAG: polysaccharide deacetylase family protein [Geobacteraceae bacterium]|nr:polysaccharide deacetylase family protein [Geobacteraceae bacterium]